MDGDRLYALVERYDALGIHRTGGPADRPTAAWVGDELQALGLSVELVDVPFERDVIESTFTVDGEPIEHLVVPYEWSGSLDTEDITLVRFDASHGGVAQPLDDAIAELHEPGKPLVLATGDHDADLRAINRRIHPGSGVPTVLIAGRDFDRAAGGVTRLRIDAARTPARTTNVFATTPRAAAGEPALIISTPLNGWFRCAGERGTGVAVLLDLVERFAEQPVLVAATGGHELAYFGVRHWVDQVLAGEGPERAMGVNQLAGVIHVGASIAVEDHEADPPRPLSTNRLAMTTAAGDAAAPIVTALETANYSVAIGAESWLGESEVFADLDLPMLSLTGAGHDFHTPSDTPERATSPHGLATAADAIATATAHLLTTLQT